MHDNQNHDKWVGVSQVAKFQLLSSCHDLVAARISGWSSFTAGANEQLQHVY